jgi:hypothetical protein
MHDTAAVVSASAEDKQIVEIFFDENETVAPFNFNRYASLDREPFSAHHDASTMPLSLFNDFFDILEVKLKPKSFVKYR